LDEWLVGLVSASNSLSVCIRYYLEEIKSRIPEVTHSKKKKKKNEKKKKKKKTADL
jgi:hypothetical protein